MRQPWALAAVAVCSVLLTNMASPPPKPRTPSFLHSQNRTTRSLLQSNPSSPPDELLPSPSPSDSQPPPPSPSKPAHLRICVSPVPPMVMCNPSTTAFTGYEVQLFQRAAALIGLVDYSFVCTGWDEFMEGLRLPLDNNASCFAAPSAVTISRKRQDMGLQFALPHYQADLAILVIGVPESASRWSFMDPYTWQVWLAVGLTALVIMPVSMVLVEGISRPSTFKVVELWPSLNRMLWRSLGMLLQLSQLKAKSLAAHVLVVVYGFLVLIIVNSYTANLAAFLAVSSITTGLNSIDDLRGQAVGTLQVYADRFPKYGIAPTVLQQSNVGADLEGTWLPYLRQGFVKALVLDSFLAAYAIRNLGCDIVELQDKQIEPFSLAVPFNVYADAAVVRAYSDAVLELQTDGTLQQLEDTFITPKTDTCPERDSPTASGTMPIMFYSMSGLWIILAGSIGLAVLLALTNCTVRKYAPARLRHRWSSIVQESRRYKTSPTSLRPGHASMANPALDLPGGSGAYNAAVAVFDGVEELSLGEVGAWAPAGRGARASTMQRLRPAPLSLPSSNVPPSASMAATVRLASLLTPSPAATATTSQNSQQLKTLHPIHSMSTKAAAAASAVGSQSQLLQPHHTLTPSALLSKLSSVSESTPEPTATATSKQGATTGATVAVVAVPAIISNAPVPAGADAAVGMAGQMGEGARAVALNGNGKGSDGGATATAVALDHVTLTLSDPGTVADPAEGAVDPTATGSDPDLDLDLQRQQPSAQQLSQHSAPPGHGGPPEHCQVDTKAGAGAVGRPATDGVEQKGPAPASGLMPLPLSSPAEAADTNRSRAEAVPPDSQHHQQQQQQQQQPQQQSELHVAVLGEVLDLLAMMERRLAELERRSEGVARIEQQLHEVWKMVHDG